jgi:hypothetical protein
MISRNQDYVCMYPARQPKTAVCLSELRRCSSRVDRSHDWFNCTKRIGVEVTLLTRIDRCSVRISAGTPHILTEGFRGLS